MSINHNVKTRLSLSRWTGCVPLKHYILSLDLKIQVTLFYGNCERNLITLLSPLQTWFTPWRGNDESEKPVQAAVWRWRRGLFFLSIRWSSWGINVCVHYLTMYQLSVETILAKRWNKISISINESLEASWCSFLLHRSTFHGNRVFYGKISIFT